MKSDLYCRGVIKHGGNISYITRLRKEIKKKKKTKLIYMFAVRENEEEIRRLISIFKVTKRSSGYDVRRDCAFKIKNRHGSWAELVWFQHF